MTGTEIEAKQALQHCLANSDPGLGDKFKNEFIEAATLFVHACEIYSNSEGVAKAEFSRSVLLADEWANWYGTHREDIKGALK